MAYIGQREDEWEAAQKKKLQQQKKKALARGPKCSLCQAPFVDSGRLKSHMRDKHGWTIDMWKAHVQVNG